MWVLIRRFWVRVRLSGVRSACQEAVRYLMRAQFAPLANTDQQTLFVADQSHIRAQEKKKARHFRTIAGAAQTEKDYPEVFKHSGRVLRYSFTPASEQPSRGLVVSFHGHDAHRLIRSGSVYKHFDLLRPWDTFGWNRRGSWFWGEKGDNFVEVMVQALISKYRSRANQGKPWFCVGASMGGFAALYHGVKFDANGIYAMCPQVDLHLKIEEYGTEDLNHPYGYLRGDDESSVPDLLGAARGKGTLPPLFLIQNQFDLVNPFSEHGFRLLEVYNAKKAWYGLRVYPAIGHGGDGSDFEADHFFTLIAARKPPWAFSD